MVYYFFTLKTFFKPCPFILKALKDILQHFKFVNSWFRFLMSRTALKMQSKQYLVRDINSPIHDFFYRNVYFLLFLLN